MKSLTFNQLQSRVLVFLFVLMTSSVIGYRYFIELPKLERSMLLLSERELNSLSFSIESSLTNLSKTGFDWAVWTPTYEFMRNNNPEYIEENIVNNIFENLGINGIFYVSEKFELIFGRGYDYQNDKEIHFSFHDFKKNPQNFEMLPEPTNSLKAPFKAGFLTTKKGASIYSVNQIRTSEEGGEHRGFLILIKLLGDNFPKRLSRHALTNVSFSQATSDKSDVDLSHLTEKNIVTEVRPSTRVIVTGINNAPVFTLKLDHSSGEAPKLINNRILGFMSLISLLFVITYWLVSKNIITPVKKLAHSIKTNLQQEEYIKLNESHTVKELVVVSRNINELISTIQKQNLLLSSQVSMDYLTQVLNRYGLKSELDKYEQQCIRFGTSFIVVMCDIDHFKSYNDHFGHTKGDESLRQVAQELNRHCRRSVDICARFGGEEFILLFSHMSDFDLNKKINSILTSIASLDIHHPKSPTAPYITVSIGATIVSSSEVKNYSLPTTKIIERADNALYKAKEKGRNSYKINYYPSEAVND